jgi:hypothetical protein
MSEHTPGPWKEETVHTANGYAIQVLGDKGQVSSVVVADLPLKFSYLPVNGHHATWDKQMANARLIAAAPALLAALEDLLDLGRAGFIRGEDIAVTRAVDAARAAIAKAKGETA